MPNSSEIAEIFNFQQPKANEMFQKLNADIVKYTIPLLQSIEDVNLTKFGIDNTEISMNYNDHTNDGKLTFNSKNEFLSTCFTRGLELVESRLFITTQDDLLPPATRHHWLTRMVELIDEHQDYTTISMKYLIAFWDTYIRRKKHGK